MSGDEEMVDKLGTIIGKAYLHGAVWAMDAQHKPISVETCEEDATAYVDSVIAEVCAAIAALPAPVPDELVELSRRATQGEWDHSDSVVWVPTYDNYGEPVQQKVADTGDEADAAFLAALVNWFRANHGVSND